MNVLVSACLLGERCRYDGTACPAQAVLDLQRVCVEGTRHEIHTLCPEVAGGLAVPRTACEVDVGSALPRVMDMDGTNRTVEFERGAQAALDVAREHACTLAVLKSNSPSCGCTRIYDGTFSSTLVPGSGITARLLAARGIRVIDEKRLATCRTEALLASTSRETPTLQTDRLTLRAFTLDDTDAVFDYSSDPDVGPHAGWSPHASIEDSRVFIDAIACAPHVFAIVEKESATVIGSVGLIPDAFRKANPSCLMLGYALGKPWWGQGYMTEAAREMVRYGFEDLGLDLVTSNCYTFNDRSRRVIEKCGLAFEGTLSGVEATPDGIMRDCRSYSMTRQAYCAGSGYRSY